MEGARRAIGPAAARGLGGPRRHDRARRGAQRALGASRDRAADRRGGSELAYELDDLYPDAIACLEGVRALGLRVGIVGNQTAALEQWARDAALPADVISSSASLGVRKPDPRFFEHDRRARRLPRRERSPTSATASTTTCFPPLRPGSSRSTSAEARGGACSGRHPRPRSGVDDLASLPAGASLARVSDLRIGLGIDAHALRRAGVPLVLGGVAIEHPRGLAGHSDGDVIAHALTDALLGAAGLADIGALFPSDDERYRGADSLELLRRPTGRCERPASRSSTPTAS